MTGRIFIVLIFVSIIGYLVALSDRPEYRYHNLPCQYDTIYNTIGDVDYLILGTSRSMQGLDPAVFTGGDPESVSVNLARNWRGPGQLYNMLEDFSKHHEIKKGIVFEITYYNNRQYYGYYKNYASSASWRQLFSDIKSKPNALITTRLGDFFSLAFSKLDKTLTNRIEKRFIAKPETRANPKDIATSSCSRGDNDYNKKRLTAAISKFEKAGGYENKRLLDWDISDINEDRNTYYVNKIIQYCEERNIEPIFVFVPRHLMYPVGTKTADSFYNQFKYPLRIMPKDQLHEMYKDDSFSDPGHLKQNGRATFSNWLFSTLEKD